VICAACGHDNPERTEFCQACRAFLGWADPVADPGEAPPARSGGGSPARGVPAPGVPAAGVPAAGVPAAAAPASGHPPVGVHGAGVPGADVPGADVPGAGVPGAGAAAGGAAAGGAAAAGGPAPGRAVRRPDERPEPAPQPQRAAGPEERRPSGDRYCPECGAGNARTRALCDRCGARLEVAEAAQAAGPWWRRIIPGGRSRQYRVGERPPGRRRRRPRLGVPILVAVLVVGGVAARHQIRRLGDYVRDQVSTPSAVNPRTEQASSAAPHHPAQAAFDNASNRCWMPNRTGQGIGQYLRVDFERPVRLLKVIVLSGCSTEKDEFLRQGRPRGLQIATMTDAGHRAVHEIMLADQPGQQIFTLREPDVRVVRITVTSTYGARPDTRVGIAEIEFFGRS
jgi:hypothetical protein